MFEDKLKALESAGLRRHIRDRQKDIIPELSHIKLDDGRYINFASNDYLGLSVAPEICEAAAVAIAEFGFGAGASRLLGGGTQYHRSLEETVSAFKGTEAALTFNSGYTANISLLPAIAGRGDAVFSDELNHASLIDACRLSNAKKIIYRHGDVADLRRLMEITAARNKIIVTDTVFSMDGDIAPLREIIQICTDHNAILYLDDAHGTGVLGNGYGALAHFKIRPEPWIIQMGTFSKAFGSFGAFAAAGESLVEWFINSARGSIFSTALPSCVAAASLKAIEVVKSADPGSKLIDRLWHNRERLYSGLQSLGVNTLCSETPIIPIVVGDVNRTMEISNALLLRNIYCPAIRPPTTAVPRLRVTVTAAHSENDIDALLDALAEVL